MKVREIRQLGNEIHTYESERNVKFDIYFNIYKFENPDKLPKVLCCSISNFVIFEKDSAIIKLFESDKKLKFDQLLRKLSACKDNEDLKFSINEEVIPCMTAKVSWSKKEVYIVGVV